MRGAPCKLTPEVQDRILRAIRDCNFIITAVEAAGICQSTFYNWKTRARAGEEPFASFFAEIEEVEAETEANIVKHLYRKGFEEDVKLLQWLLERRSRNWNKTQQIQQEVTEQQQIIINIPQIGGD